MQDLVDKVDGKTNLASMGIVYVDEMDKVRGTAGSFNKKGVNNLLKMLEETEVSLERPEKMKIQLPALQFGKAQGGAKTINTQNIGLGLDKSI